MQLLRFMRLFKRYTMIDRSLMTKGGGGDDSSCRFKLIEISDSDPDDRVIDWN